MTANRDFKRLVRGRMQKTGESYTAARSQLLRHSKPSVKTEALAAPSVVAAAKPDYAKLAGMSDAAIKAKTGCPWERWVSALDRVEAHEWPHREIADYVHTKYKVPDWWTQAVTVGYERIKGLRDKGQRRGGGYEASRSRVFPVPLAKLYRAWHDGRTRARWLPGERVTVRTAIAGKSMRITWTDGTSVQVYFVAKGPAKSQLAVQHTKLVDRADVDRRKAFWGERFTALGELLVPAKAKRTSA